jgi:hypothetical protein
VEKGARARARLASSLRLREGFIRAETIAYDDYVAFNGETGARRPGFRLEGKGCGAG